MTDWLEPDAPPEPPAWPASSLGAALPAWSTTFGGSAETSGNGAHHGGPSLPGVPSLDGLLAWAGSFEPGDLVDLLIDTLRLISRLSGTDEADVDAQVAGQLAFLRRRITGEFLVDDYGFDQDFTENFALPVLRPLFQRWFRVDVLGIENIPDEGSGLIVMNHSGTLALDVLMVTVAVHDRHPQRRFLRGLGADFLFNAPVLGDMARKSGATLASGADATRLLEGGELVLVCPEGIKGIGKPFSERYKLQRFGRGGFVSAAVAANAPIIPCSVVGAEEIYPNLANVPALAKLLGWPYFPITPTFPHLGLLGLVPLPSKWIVDFSPAIEITSNGDGADAASDPMLMFEVTDRVRETIQRRLYALLAMRGSTFF